MTSEKLTPMEEIATAFALDDYMYFHSDFLTPAHSDAETEMICARLGMDQRMNVLDLACGFGRIANRLALRGHNVLGVEFLPGFLDIARFEARQMAGRIQRAGGAVAFRQGDMRKIDQVEEFERVVMVFNSFGYFNDGENRRVLENAARALKPGGLLGFDVAHRDGVLNNFHPHYVTEKEGNLLISRFSFDPQTGILRNDRIVIRDGERRDRPINMRLYSATELRALLTSVGLELVAFYEEWDGSDLQMDSPSMVVIARK
jgi:SAM-dependent methyltransferase